MSLYVRVFTNFYTHRKTMRLRAILGDDAFWIPPRLWAYAAENQPDGDFAGYTDGEIAGLIGYNKDASSMLQALLQACFLDPDKKVHNWCKHNGYHEAFSKRASQAAKAKWDRVREVSIPPTPPKEKTGNEKKRQETSIASSMLGACSVYSEYPLKVGKPAALRSIQKAIEKHTYEHVLARTKLFAATRNGDTSFCPHPSTWFNQERYNDDPATWKREDSSRTSAKGFDRNSGTLNDPSKYNLADIQKRRALREAQQLPSVNGSTPGHV